MTPPLRSPVTGSVLLPEGADLLRDSDGQLWPVLDGIPFLRVGRDALVVEAADCLRAGDRDGALVRLLADQDDWWTGAKPDEAALRRLIRERDRLSLRDAMDLLSFERVGHYFAHRWSDPTFLAGLALLEAHWRAGDTAFELACGIGHYGREIARRGHRFTGGDVVFSKLWLARHWVLPADATLLCFDAAAPWPVANQRFDLAFCHDAFYFLEPKPAIVAALRALAGPAGRIAISHIHNSEADNLSAGRAVSANELAQLFPAAIVYDDAELTRAAAEGRAPSSAPLAELRHVEAFSLEDRAAPVRALSSFVVTPSSVAPLRINPLYQPDGDDLAIVWPSARYQAEYAAHATYPPRLPGGVASLQTCFSEAEAARRRILVDLPDRW